MAFGEHSVRVQGNISTSQAPGSADNGASLAGQDREETSHRDASSCQLKSLNCEETQEQQSCRQGQVSFDMSSPLTLQEVQIAAGQGDERAAKALSDLGRLSEAKQKKAAVAMLHRLATARGRGQYIDPATGFMVFTATFLKQRACCGLGCRHCPHLGSASKGCGSDAAGAKVKELTASLVNDW